jgi:type I site-specific restriction endonuclease
MAFEQMKGLHGVGSVTMGLLAGTQRANPSFEVKVMTAQMFHGETFAMFDPSDGIGDAVADDPAVHGMQLAMAMQRVAPSQLISEAAQRFQRGWYLAT